MTEASWALVGVTAVLVLLTGWYATETHRTVKRMDRQREETSRPILTFQLVPWQPGLLKLRVQNIGGGPAIRVNGSIETVLQSELATVPWSYPLLASGGYEEFGFPMPPGASNKERFNLDSIRDKVTKVRAKFSYESASGCKYTMDDEIEVQQITDDWAASRMMATQDHPERLLPRIAKALEELVKKHDS